MIRKRDELVDKQVARHDFNIKEKESEPKIRFYELSIVVRAGDIDSIIALLPAVCNSFALGNKIGSYCNDSSNYSFILDEK